MTDQITRYGKDQQNGTKSIASALHLEGKGWLINLFVFVLLAALFFAVVYWFNNLKTLKLYTETETIEEDGGKKVKTVTFNTAAIWKITAFFAAMLGLWGFTLGRVKSSMTKV